MNRRPNRPTRPTIADMMKVFGCIDAMLAKLADGWIHEIQGAPVFLNPKDGVWYEIPAAMEGWIALWERIDARYTLCLDLDPALLDRVPAHKRLTSQPAHLGLPIGNLSSQFFANIYLDVLDQHVKHHIGGRHYVRYVDDFILLHESPQWLNAAREQIEAFLPATLHARLNPSKTILQPIDRGVDFVGHVIKPWHARMRRRTYHEALRRTATVPAEDLHATANSYFGLLRQATHSHHDRAQLANVARRRGHFVNFDLTKIYRRAAA